MKHPAKVVPGAMQAMQSLAESTRNSDLPAVTLILVHLRASQINGCAPCVYDGVMAAREEGETEDRLATVAAWRDAPFFTDAERSALALTESVTRLADRPDPVPDEVWDEAARHYDERELATLVLAIGMTNILNRLNLTTRQVARASD